MINNINSPNSYQVSSSGLKQDDIQKTLSKSKQAVSDNFESNSAVKTVGGTKDPDVMRKTLLLLPPLVVVNRFADKLIGGTEEKSILTKVANVGDKISNVLHLDKLVSNETDSKVSNFMKNNRFFKYFSNDFKAIPKTSMAKSQTMAEKYSQELVSNLTELKYNPNFAELFTSGRNGLSQKTLQALEKLGPLKNAVTDDYLVSVMNALEDLAVKSIDDVDKTAITNLQSKIVDFAVKASEGNVSSTKGLADDIAAVLSKFMSNEKYKDVVLSSKDETIKVLSSVSQKASSTLGTDQLIGVVDDIMSKGVDTIKQGSLTSDPVSLSTLQNKLKASSSKLGKTGIGKGLAKGTLKAKDVITFGGGLLSLAFTANAIIQASKAAKEAPKGEKKSTFMHVLSEQYIGMILFQPSINLLYKAGGNKYRGMTEAGRAALKDLIAKTNADETITKEALKVAKIQKDLLIKGVDKDKVATLTGKGLAEVKTAAKTLKNEGAKLKFWEKPLKLMGKILDTGLDKMQKPKFAKLPVLGKVKIPQPTLKGFVGGLGRFALIMFVIQPFIQKPITKLCHKIFGKPETYLKKQEASSSANNAQQPQAVSAQPNAQQPAPAIQNPAEVVNNNVNSETNLIKKWTLSPIDEANNQPQVQVQPQTVPNNGLNPLPAAAISNAQSVSQPLEPKQNEEIPALNLFNKDKKAENSERYIPSITPVQAEDNEAALQAEVNSILKSTDSIIANSKKYL